MHSIIILLAIVCGSVYILPDPTYTNGISVDGIGGTNGKQGLKLNHWSFVETELTIIRTLDDELFTIKSPTSIVSRVEFRLPKRVGLIVGANSVDLHGCILDAQDIYEFLRPKYDELVFLKGPTAFDIHQHLAYVVSTMQRGDTMFFFYAGHGKQTNDTNGDELDGQDECLLPWPDAVICDDILHSILERLPSGTTVNGLFDSCHSGTVLDLPYETRGSTWRFSKRTVVDTVLEDRNMVSFSGCLDWENTKERVVNGVPRGLFTMAVTKALRLEKVNTYEGLLASVARRNLPYTSLLSASHKFQLTKTLLY